MYLGLCVCVFHGRQYIILVHGQTATLTKKVIKWQEVTKAKTIKTCPECVIRIDLLSSWEKKPLLE